LGGSEIRVCLLDKGDKDLGNLGNWKGGIVIGMMSKSADTMPRRGAVCTGKPSSAKKDRKERASPLTKRRGKGILRERGIGKWKGGIGGKGGKGGKKKGKTSFIAPPLPTPFPLSPFPPKSAQIPQKPGPKSREGEGGLHPRPQKASPKSPKSPKRFNILASSTWSSDDGYEVWKLGVWTKDELMELGDFGERGKGERKGDKNDFGDFGDFRGKSPKSPEKNSKLFSKSKVNLSLCSPVISDGDIEVLSTLEQTLSPRTYNKTVKDFLVKTYQRSKALRDWYESYDDDAWLPVIIVVSPRGQTYNRGHLVVYEPSGCTFNGDWCLLIRAENCAINGAKHFLANCTNCVVASTETMVSGGAGNLRVE
jgi:hypothetical protein